MEEQRAQHEGDYHREAPQKRARRDGHVGDREPVEVEPVRRDQQCSRKRNAPPPLERVAPHRRRLPHRQQKRIHGDKPELEPELHRLDGNRALLKQELILEVVQC